MKLCVTWIALLLVLSSLAFAQTAQPAPAQQQAQKPPTISSVLERSLTSVEREFVGAADAMPEDKYAFAPTNGEFKGVRTFAEQVKHVAFVNYMVFSPMVGEAAPTGDDNENGPATIKTKAEIMKYLRDSFALAHRAIVTINEQNSVEPLKLGRGTATRLGMTTMIVGHCFDHYGQMVEYLRMNGIIPPASRR